MRPWQTQFAAIGAMSEYAIIFQVLGALLALFAIFLTYMNTKTWRWVHVTFTFLVFIASVAFCVFAAETLKTRFNWIKLHDDLEKRLATAEEDLERTTRGDPTDVEGKKPSVYSVREELGRTVLDRGRVWRGCERNFDPRTWIAQVRTSPPPDPNNPAAGPVKKNNIQPKTILHAFLELQKSAEGPALPAAYIGEFMATAVTDNTVTLAPTTFLLPEQVAAGQAAGTWALYETCPVDGHDWFTGDEKQRLEPLADAAGLERWTPDQINRIATPYLRDGTQATDNDPPENVWWEVKFDQEYEVAVDAPVVNSVDVEPFNTEGQAVLERLRRKGGTTENAGKVKFGPKEGQIQTAVLDQNTAQDLIDKKIATLVKKIYRRTLTDYEREFHAVNERMVEINTRLRQLDLDNKAMLAATEKAQQQQALVEELKGKVMEDISKVKYEVAELQRYAGALSTQLDTTQTELSQLYRANKAVGRELARLTAELTEQINRRTREATARTP
jgi:hypothetical protein